MRSVPVTAAAVASCFGNDVSSLRRALRECVSGVKTGHRFSETIAAPLAEMDHRAFSNEVLPPEARDSLLVRMVLGTVRKILAESGVSKRYRPEEIGFFFGTTTGGLEVCLPAICAYIEARSDDLLDHLDRGYQHGIVESAVRGAFPIRGFGATFATACSSGALAIAEGVQAIESGLVKACIVGGFDVLCPMTLLGFTALQLLSPQACAPFWKETRGISLGEGGAFLLLETSPDGKAMGFVRGFGAASDGYHMTHPEPEGKGMRLAMERALASAGLSAQEIDYINAHGTGTSANDSIEAKSIASLFGSSVPVSSTKGLTGHTLGGSGALEAVVSLLALQESTPWRGVARDEMNPDVHHADGQARAGMRHVLSNSFGFGGSNVSLVLSKEEA